MLLPYFELLIPILGILLPVVICWIIFYFIGKNEDRKHNTLRELVKSGQQITPEVLEGLTASNKRNPVAYNDIRRGAIILGVGLGLAFLGYFGLAKMKVFGVGAFIAIIGLAFLLYGVFTENSQKLIDKSK